MGAPAPQGTPLLPLGGQLQIVVTQTHQLAFQLLQYLNENVV